VAAHNAVFWHLFGGLWFSVLNRWDLELCVPARLGGTVLL